MTTDDREAKKSLSNLLRTWWGKLVTVCVAVVAVLTVVISGLSLADRVGWTSPVPAPLAGTATPGSAAPAPPVDNPSGKERYHAGWGPKRDIFTTKNPARYAVLNSIVDNPAFGDERYFVQVRQASAPSEAYTDLLAVSPGDEVRVYVYVSNNAADNFAGSTGSLHGLRAQAVVGENSKVDHYVSVILSAKNATQVWGLFTNEGVVGV